MTRVFRFLVLSVITVACLTTSLFAQQALQNFGPPSPPPVPPEIQVPPGNSVFLLGRAVGTQNYICQVSGVTYSWKFIGPQATLFFTLDKRGAIFQLATHFLSLNPFETGTARPTWQGSADSSAVWGAPIASSSDSRFVAPGAVAWLLVQIKGAQLGPAGGDLLSRTTFIHRVNTSGGVAPSNGCGDPGDVGRIAFVSYTADYYFYRASN